VSKLVSTTNLLLSSFISAGPPRIIVNRIRDRLDLLCLSPPILEKYLTVLQRAGVAEVFIASSFSHLHNPDRIFLVLSSDMLWSSTWCLADREAKSDPSTVEAAAHHLRINSDDPNPFQ